MPAPPLALALALLVPSPGLHPGTRAGASATAGSSIESAAVSRAYGAALGRARTTAIAGSDLRLPPPSWDEPRIGRSEHYEIRTIRGRGWAAARAQELETTLTRLHQTLGSDFVPPQRFVVLVHPTQELYNRFGDAHSDQRSSIYGGFYDPSNPERAAAVLQNDNLALQKMYLTHAATVQFLGRAYPNAEPPTALVHSLSAFLQSYVDYNYFVDRFEALRDGREGQGLVPLEQLLTEPIDAYLPWAGDRFYQLAMLFWYLRNVREDTKSTTTDEGPQVGPFEEYVRLRLSGGEFEDHPVHELLTEGADVVDEEMRAFRGWR
ncbi:MAG: hypothetical protein AAGI22_10225 [Planctomycetota bacterium]